MRGFRHTEPGPDEFERLARAAMRRLPARFRRHLDDIVLRIEEFADAETLRGLGLNDRWGLSGLYHGVPLSEQSVWSSGGLPPSITLYRQPLLAEWRETGVDLADLVNHVVVHEVAHHFGLSDAEIYAIEKQAR